MASAQCKWCQPPKPATKSSSSHSQAPRTFTPFPRLSAELRLKIWQHAALQPCEIKLYTLSPEWMSAKMKEQTRAPAIMHTCHESREEGKRFYIECCEKASPVRSFPRQKSTVWVNFSVDRFVYASGYEASFRQYYKEGFNFDESILDRIQHLALFNTRESTLWSGLEELRLLLQKKELQDFTLIQQLWDNGGSENVEGTAAYVGVIRRLIKDLMTHKKIFMWKFPIEIEWRCGMEEKSQAKFVGVQELPCNHQSENPSVVMADGGMIWEFDEEFGLSESLSMSANVLISSEWIL